MSDITYNSSIEWRGKAITPLFTLYPDGRVVFGPDLQLTIEDLQSVDLQSLYLLREVVAIAIYDKERDRGAS